MVESKDINKLYSELSESIKKGNHEETLEISQKILKKDTKEKEAMQCKIISLINLGKVKEAEECLSTENKKEEFVLEYAYSLYDLGKYDKSIQHLEYNKKNNPSISNEINILLAQNYNKLGEYKKSYELYKQIITQKKENLENESDLLTNYLAVYALSDSNDFEFLKSLQKYITTWECYYNYSLIFLNKNKYNECIGTMKRCKEDINEGLDEFNSIKEKLLNFFILHNLFDGFDINKVSNINTEYEKIIKDDKFKKNDNYPYFYNNYLYIKKEIEPNHEIIKKLDSFLNIDKLSSFEKKVILKNKINFYMRNNKLTEASDLINKALEEDINKKDIDFQLMKSFIYYKNEKDNFYKLIENDPILKNQIGPQIFILQILLSTINLKTYETFHNKVINFIDNYREFCLNSKFIMFFIGFYTSKKLFNYLQEFLNKLDNLDELKEHNEIQDSFKSLILKLADIYYKLGDYNKAIKYCEYYLEKYNQNEKSIKLFYVQCLSHINITKCDEYRRNFDDNTVDLGYEHINNLLDQLFTKCRKVVDKQKKVEKKKKKKKIRYPKNFNPKCPGPEPDPEKWIPRLQRKKYRNLKKNKMAYQGASADNKTTTQKFK